MQSRKFWRDEDECDESLPPSELKDEDDSDKESEDLSLLSDEPSTKRFSATSRIMDWSDRTAREIARTSDLP